MAPPPPTEKRPAPEGTRPMMISMREMDTYHLKTGSGLRETVPFKVFAKHEILEQIAQIGFMCPFHEFRADVAKLQGDDLLIIADPTETYGENWLLCLTRKAFETQMELIQTREREAQDALAAQEKAAAAGSDDAAAIVYEDRPVIARAWTSTTTRESNDEVESLSIHSTRQLIKISVTKMSDELQADYKFSDRDADQLGFVEWRQHKDPNYELTRMEQDIGLQGIPELTDNATQTSWFRSVNSALQYASITMPPTQQQTEFESDKLYAFLASVLPLVEDALQQNETLDIFLDPFANLFEDDSAGVHGNAHKNENAIKELRSFTDLVYSKNKTLPAIDWHPKKNGVVAVAAAANVSFAKRLDLLEKTENSYILIWNFVDLIHPQLMLEAPQDVLALRFNPTHPTIVAAGLYNGQVMVWDYSKAEQSMTKGKAKPSASSKADDDTPKQVPPVKPLYVSYIDASHRRPVADLLWLPAGMEVNNRGHVVASSDLSVQQFVTIAGDGQVSFWDLRFKDPKYRGLSRSKADKQTAAAAASSMGAKDLLPDVHFTPIYSIALTKVDTTGELGLKCICLERPKDDAGATAAAGAGAPPTPTQLTSRFYCGTEEGELVYADWRPHAVSATAGSSAKSNASHDHDSGGGGGGGGADDGGGVEYVQWLCRDYFRATLTVRVSPFFSSILMSVSETNFHLWNVSQVHKAAGESNGPIFTSPLSLAAYTCAAFSPTRPSVVYVGRADGMLEVWDFMDQSHRASLVVGVTACPLTSIEFRPQTTGGGGGGGGAPGSGAAASSATAATAKGAKASGAAPVVSGAAAGGGVAPPNQPVKQQLMAIGDQIGNLHIMEIPRTLSRATIGERQTMEGYFKRESERMKATRETVAQQQQQQQQVTSGGGGGGRRDDAPPRTASAPPPPATAATASSMSASTNGMDDELFKQMENEFCRELGLDAASIA